MHGGAHSIDIEVCYATRDRQFLIPLAVCSGLTVGQAIRESGILEQCPEIRLSENRVGIFGSLAELDQPVSAGDRIEIYRPLPNSPQELRRRRASAQAVR